MFMTLCKARFGGSPNLLLIGSVISKFLNELYRQVENKMLMHTMGREKKRRERERERERMRDDRLCLA